MAAAQVLTTVGKGMVTAALVAANIGQYIGWGTGATTAAVADTALTTEVVDTARATGTPSQQTTTVANDTYQVLGILTATQARNIFEVGTFSAVTAGNMMVHASFASAYPLNTGDSITFKVQTQFT